MLAIDLDSQNLQCISSTSIFRSNFPKPIPPFALIGLGPYAKSHYFSLFKRYEFSPDLIVELDSKKTSTQEFLAKYGISAPLYFIPEESRDLEDLPVNVKKDLLKLIADLGITHAIIATEPKAHFAYLDFFIENGVHVLVEKPLTAPLKSSFLIESALKIEQNYNWLISKIKESPNKKLRVDLQCHRRYHPVYQFVTNEIEKFVAEFNIPLTFCDVYHSDGMWNMPDEFLFRENHPYKYGYGKLLHSGFHFIDLVAWIIKSCFKVCSKVPNEAEIYGIQSSPYDFLNVFNQNDYQRFFNTEEYNEIFHGGGIDDFKNFGELDFFGLMQLFKENRVLTTVSMNLLQTGFCRRKSNRLPEDTYKKNGRIRHERLNLQFGPLFNIQVQSYLSHESHERSTSDPTLPGNSRHFDVFLFRNSQLIGGDPFTHLTANHFMESSSCFNEISREKSLYNFLFDQLSLSALSEYSLGIKILSNALQTLCKKNEHERIEKRTFALDPTLFDSTYQGKS